MANETAGDKALAEQKSDRAAQAAKTARDAAREAAEVADGIEPLPDRTW